MAYPTRLDGAALHSWAGRAVACLSARRAELNALNVFPVPDADTGSNMAHTMESALAEADKLFAASEESGSAVPSVHNVAAALASGSVRGARGNSGVVLTQVLRGIAQVAAHGNIDGTAVRDSLAIALDMVDRAITDPVEGTVLTVLRATSVAANEEDDDSLHAVVKAAVDAARTALANTPSQLDVLRDAGVVDAGGQGFVFLMETLLDEIEGREDERIPEPLMAVPQGVSAGMSGLQSVQHIGAKASNHPVPVLRPTFLDTPGTLAAAPSHSPGRHRRQPDPVPEPRHPIDRPSSHGSKQELEVMFFFHVSEQMYLEQLESRLSELGNSLAIARETETFALVHIHSAEAGKVIETAFALGEVTGLRLEVLPDPTKVDAPTRIVLAVAPEGTLARLFQDAGAVVVTTSADEDMDEVEIVSRIVAAVRRYSASEVIFLPNGMLSKRELVSAELASHASERSMTILSTSKLVNGLAALAVHDPTQPVAVDAYAMTEAANNMRTADMHPATRAALTQAGACSKGDILVESGGQIVLVEENIQDAVNRTCDLLLQSGGEMVTILATDDARADIDLDVLQRFLEPWGDVDIAMYPAEGMKYSVEIGVE